MIYDLNNVLISVRIYQTWLAYVTQAVTDLELKFPDLKSWEIPDEQFELLPDGTGEIFVIIRGCRLKLAIPKNEFKIV